MKHLETADTGVLCQELLSVLRTELQEYGGLLNLLDDQQEKILNRESEALMSVNRQIELQADANRLLKETRERIVGLLANEWGAESKSRVSQLISFFPEPMQPLLETLTTDINGLISKSRRRLEQNRLLLKRLSAITEEMLSFISPDLVPNKTYSHCGAMQVKPSASTRGSVELTA